MIDDKSRHFYLLKMISPFCMPPVRGRITIYFQNTEKRFLKSLMNLHFLIKSVAFFGGFDGKSEFRSKKFHQITLMWRWKRASKLSIVKCTSCNAIKLFLLRFVVEARRKVLHVGVNREIELKVLPSPHPYHISTVSNG